MKKHTLVLKFIRFVSLNMLGMAALSGYLLADTYFIAGGAGADGLTALNIAIPAFSLMNGCTLMVGMGGAAAYTIAKEKSRKLADSCFSAALIIAASMSVVFMLIGGFAAEPLAVLLGADEEVKTLTATYIRVLLLFSPLFFGNNLMNAFVRNDGAPQLSMAGMVVGSLTNIVLDYVFVFPMGMGLFGAALATAIAPAVSLTVQSYHLIRRRNGFHFTKRFAPSAMKKVFALGVSSFVNELGSGVTIMVFNLLILRYSGNVGVAAYGVIANCSLVAVSLFTGMANGVQPLSGEAFGKGDGKSVRTYYGMAIKSAAALALMIYAVCALNAVGIADIFNSENSPRLTVLAAKGIRLYFAGFIFAGINIITAVFFSSVGSAREAFIISVLRGAVLIVPMAAVLSLLFGMTGIWLSFTVTEAVVCAFSLALAARYFSRQKFRSAA